MNVPTCNGNGEAAGDTRGKQMGSPTFAAEIREEEAGASDKDMICKREKRGSPVTFAGARAPGGLSDAAVKQSTMVGMKTSDPARSLYRVESTALVMGDVWGTHVGSATCVEAYEEGSVEAKDGASDSRRMNRQHASPPSAQPSAWIPIAFAAAENGPPKLPVRGHGQRRSRDDLRAQTNYEVGICTRAAGAVERQANASSGEVESDVRGAARDGERGGRCSSAHWSV